jgi:hypothetical protein
MTAEMSKSFRVVQESWFSGETAVHKGERWVGRFSFSGWTRAGAIVSGDESWEVIRAGVLSGALRFECAGVAPCETRIEGLWNRRAKLQLEGVRYEVVWPALDVKATVTRDGEEVGCIGAWKGIRVRTEAAFQDSVPDRVCFLALWLAAYKHRDDRSG